jgi:hypothetical protein
MTQAREGHGFSRAAETGFNVAALAPEVEKFKVNNTTALQIIVERWETRKSNA